MQEFLKIIEDFSDEVFTLKKIIADSGTEFEDVDLYLIDNLFPALFPGLEELSREVEKLQNPDVIIDPNVRSRFNPCLFLAQYLMRNNPKYNIEQYKDDKFRKYSERVRKTRYFDKISLPYKRYFKAQNKNKDMLSMRDMESIVRTLDTTMNLEGKLLTDLGDNSKIIEHKEDKTDIHLDDFFIEFVKTVIKNDFIKLADLQYMVDVLKINPRY